MASNSDPGAAEFQDLPVGDAREPLYQVVARHVATSWNRNGNCVLVVGAPYPEKIAAVRREAPDLPLLILGIGAQGAAIPPAIAAAKDARGQGMIVSSSRAVLYASSGPDFAQAARQVARQLHDAIDAARR
jgi:orotidine-5'-phosphate decarboxylase